LGKGFVSMVGEMTEREEKMTKKSENLIFIYQNIQMVLFDFVVELSNVVVVVAVKENWVVVLHKLNQWKTYHQ
jgi:hypothetical protein